jgi:hypothetical protein
VHGQRRSAFRGATSAAFAFALVLASALAACTATQVREHTRESYRQPEASVGPQVRVFAAPRERVYEALLAWLIARSVEVEDADAQMGRVVADLRFGSDAAQGEAVRMGSVRTVVTRTHRQYKSYWPFEAHCDECIIRRGNLISSKTELADDRVVALDAASYEMGALLRAVVEESPDGARVELRVDFRVRPRWPLGVEPTSTGVLEEAVFEALEQALHDPSNEG